MTVAEFLAARLGDDEARAKGWQEPGGTHWPWLEERMLRQVSAMRAILAEHRAEYITDKWTVCSRCVDWSPGSFHGYEGEGDDPPDEQHRMDWPCATVRHLAAVWSDHEQYDERWKP